MSNNPTTGVAGNTNIPQQQHAAAGSSATTNRLKSFIKNNKVLVGILALVAVYTVITTFVSASMGLGGLLVTLFLLRYAHKQYEKNSKPSVSSLIGHLIAAVIALVIINSNYVQKPLEWFNLANQEVGAVDISKTLLDCIDREPIEEDGYFTLQKGCDAQSIITPDGFVPRFHIADKRFKGSFDDWVPSAWDEHRGNTINFTPKKWPAGVTEVSVQMVSVTRAAKIDTAVKKAEEINAIFKP